MDKASRKTRNHVPTPLNRNWKDPNVLQLNTCGEALIYTSSYGPNCQNHPRTWVNISTKKRDFDNPSRLDHIYCCILLSQHLAFGWIFFGLQHVAMCRCLHPPAANPTNRHTGTSPGNCQDEHPESSGRSWCRLT